MMTDDQIQELILDFIDERGGYVAGASERALFLMVKQAVEAERERCARIAESFIPSGFTSDGKAGNTYAVARDDRARSIAAAIRALP
jgi:hypothetical protein